MKKFNELTVGDIVVEHIPNDRRNTPREATVSKIGKKYFYINVGYGKDHNYPIETGYGEYGYQIFPGTLKEFKTWNEEKEMIWELSNEIEKCRIYNIHGKHLTKNQIERIREILNEE